MWRKSKDFYNMHKTKSFSRNSLEVTKYHYTFSFRYIYHGTVSEMWTLYKQCEWDESSRYDDGEMIAQADAGEIIDGVIFLSISFSFRSIG